MKNRWIGMILLLLSLSWLGGCAVGQQIRYHDTELDLNASNTTSVAVATQDNRPYVKDGEKDRSYVGNFRGGFGNPFDVTTASGKPLADDMTSVICTSLQKKGFACTPLFVEPNESQAQAIEKLRATGAHSSILLTVNEWMSSTFQNTGLSYNLVLTAMDQQGAKVAEKKLQGEEELGGSFWDPPGHAKDAVPRAFKNKLEVLLNDPEMIKALK